MRKLKIEKTEDTPDIILDKENEIFMFSGKSFPENIDIFYGPVLEWISEYMHTPNQKTEIVFKMEYFNTASSKKLLEILVDLEQLLDKNREVVVKWYYSEEDDDMRSAGRKFKQLTRLPIELESY